MPFSKLNLSEPLLRAVRDLGYSAPTAIQEKAIPLILSGKDIIGHSETGSGKTAAFGLPMLSLIKPGAGIQALVLTPTRELCLQVSGALAGFSKYLGFHIVPVFGGVGIGNQLHALRNADVVVATPGRLLDVLSRGIKLSSARYVVLDEADRMLDMGFIEDVEKILRQTAHQRQTLLFSATMCSHLRSLVNKYMKAPVSIQTKTHVDTGLLIERAYPVSVSDKFSLLVHCLKHETPGIALVFCATRRNCNRVAKRLRVQKIEATAIHGGMSQGKRTQTIENLHKRGIGILVATDVASRGLHIDNISHVYNYDLPQNADDYTHRIGRTARAGAKGDAITFVTPQDKRDFEFIVRNLGRQIAFAQPSAFEKVIEVFAPTHDKHFHRQCRQANSERRQGFEPPRKDFGDKTHKFSGQKPRFDGPRNDFGNKKPEFGSKSHKFSSQKPRFDGPRNDFGDRGRRFGGQKPRFDGPRNDFGDKQEFGSSQAGRFGDKKPEFGSKSRKFHGQKRRFGSSGQTGGGFKGGFGSSNRPRFGKKRFRRSANSSTKFWKDRKRYHSKKE
jgi:ATP-dependent RNA helicase DeaD